MNLTCDYCGATATYSETSYFVRPGERCYIHGCVGTMRQPAPTPNDKPAVWPLVIADMQARDKAGRAKYGVPLQPHNGRDGLLDLYQELLDACVYARTLIFERDGK